MKDYKWANAERKAQLNKIMELLEDKIEVINYPKVGRSQPTPTIIIPNNYKEIIKEHITGLNKEFYKYANYHYSFIVREDYERKKRKDEEEKEIQRKKEEKKNKEAQEAIAQNKHLQSVSKDWKDKQWIEQNVGIYYTWEPQIEYFWTLIGNNWKVKDWKGNISIEEDTYKVISKTVYCGIKGSIFLSRKFKNKKGFSIEIVDTYTKPAEHYGVYGIYLGDELVYIGSTMREFVCLLAIGRIESNFC